VKEKVLIWGTGREFWQLYNIIILNDAIGNFEIVGYVSKDKNVKHINKSDVIFPEDISTSGIVYDYIIVCTSAYYKEIADYASRTLNIARSIIINGKVLKIPYFDWNNYIRLYKSGISIITESCLGGGIMQQFRTSV
jgi:hypothetical protein